MVKVLLGGQEVPDILIVNLEVGTSNEKLHCAVVIWAVVNEAVDVLECVWDDAPVVGVSIFDSHHSVRFPASSLTIGKDGAIVAFKYGFHERKSAFVINCPLIRVLIIHSIIGESLLLTTTTTLADDYLVHFFVDLDAHLVAYEDNVYSAYLH